MPPCTRKIWHYDKADFVAVKRSIEMFRWQEYPDSLICPNEQAKLLNGVLMNIYSNFIPHKVKTIRPHEEPWVTQTVKNFLRKKNHAYRNFARGGHPDDKLGRLQSMISEGSRLIEDAKRNYFLKAGRMLVDRGIGSKKYWSVINTILNEAKIPIIPPLLENGIFITKIAEKAEIFNDYFILQCTTIDTGSVLPQCATPVTASILNDFVISEEKILNIIRSRNLWE